MTQTVAAVLQVVDIICAVLGFISLAVSIFSPGFRRQKYCVAMCVSVFMLSMSHLYAFKANTDDAMVIVYKIGYLGIPFTGFFTCFFLQEYVGSKQLNKWVQIPCIAVGVFVALVVQLYPHVKLVHSTIITHIETITYGTSVPGPLYYFVQVYNPIFFIAGAVITTPRIKRVFGIRNALLMLTVSLLPLVIHALKLSKLVPFLSVWDALPATENIALFAWCAHIWLHKSTERVALGRDNALQKMNDGYLLVGSAGELLDANDGAYSFFPDLGRIELGRRIDNGVELPKELFDPNATGIMVNSDSGDYRYYTLTRTPIVFNKRESAQAIIITDNTENHQLIEQLRLLSRQDPLTKLNNRAAFFSDVGRGYALVLRNGQPGAAIMMDIDHFKSINDRYGHAAGDIVLLHVAELLKQRLRGTDIVARYGGEEFCAWLPNASPHGAYEVAESIRRSVSDYRFEVAKNTMIEVTLSLGVATFAPGRTDSLDDLLKLADDNLYRAKNCGRNCVVVSEIDTIAVSSVE